MDRSEATFRFTVHNFREMKDSVLSPPCYVRNLPWRILVKAAGRKSLGFFLQCNPDTDSDSLTWSCNASAELRLLSYKPNTKPCSRKIQHLFYGKENDWGFAHFMAWNDVLNEDTGYVKDGSITLEVHVKAEAPNGITTVSKKETAHTGQDQEIKIVNKHNYKMVEEENKCNAEKCLQIAESAYQSGNYQKAERLLLKAERLYPTTIAKEMLKDVKSAKNDDTVSPQENEDTESNNSESSNTTFSGEYCRTDEDKKTAETCVEIAESAISKGNFDKAKNFLLKSLRIFPNDLAKELIKNLDGLKRNYTPTSYTNGTRSSLGNKDEAEKCIQIAETEFSACRLARAERLLHKAERLCPTMRAKDLLRQIRDAVAKGVKDAEEGKPHKPRQSRQENGIPCIQNQENERTKRQGPTAEQVEAIRRVKESKNDFEILGLQKQCTPGEVKKAFRRLTLVLHPDKNKAPGAKEAFMMASEASERLRKKIQTNDA